MSSHTPVLTGSLNTPACQLSGVQALADKLTSGGRRPERAEVLRCQLFPGTVADVGLVGWVGGPGTATREEGEDDGPGAE